MSVLLTQWERECPTGHWKTEVQKFCVSVRFRGFVCVCVCVCVWKHGVCCWRRCAPGWSLKVSHYRGDCSHKPPLVQCHRNRATLGEMCPFVKIELPLFFLSVLILSLSLSLS